ncbi:VanZ family protein [Ferrimonas aestuarii]|uniref:VanZ family protein n=1 Tax=Ferrimonas aestuarii TaxID=2569539 RepID=A0A4U1BIA8_9GAMM|nr:VanZ family protein [Ferrimonas aestuarii]TKB50840.1 VanZ family protein [Ferrimonas aestuarii]
MTLLLHPNQRQRKWFRLLLLITLGIFSLLLFGNPDYPQPVANTDKWAHLFGFASLALLLHLAFRWPFWLHLTTLALYAGLVEVIQSFLPYRYADPMDWAADMLGALLMLTTLEVMKRRWQPQQS